MKERIQKVLANYGVDSRRNIETMILQGRVAVNGRVVTKLPILIDPEKDHVTVDDEPVKLATTRKGKKPVEKLYFLLNKPRGVYSTNVAQGEQKLAKDLLPPNLPSRVYPVGRLDADSKGLLLMTNDGELTNLLTHPRYEVPKTYRAEVDGYVTDDEINKLRKGVYLVDKDGDGSKTEPCIIKITHRSKDQTILEITIREGRNRQVRRMLARVEHKVRDLMRVKMGPLTLLGVSSGKFRPLTPREVKALYSLAKDRTQKVPTKPAPKKPGYRAVEQADATRDLAVEFEDDELLREAGITRGDLKPPKAKTKTTDADIELEPGDESEVEFVDLTDDEQAELEAEARLATQDDDEMPE
ncbi:pseudouridine synthase [Humisphaera borealis]|uniref:pseudouridine synthase n=1 Tax=Humisphaera borealis TaxID=2807512 RepID=UPI0019D3054A|nr:pseudouridine synthase [Humisphaera borealis]